MRNQERVWTLRRAGVLSDPDDLKLLTSEAAGWDLWRNEVLPVTLAFALHQRARGRHFTTTDNSWAHELIGWVEEASTASKSPN